MTTQESILLPLASDPKVDLTNCDREPIHIPGSIQPHGLLIALQEPEMVIVQTSVNTALHIGIEPNELLGQPWQCLLEPADIAHITSDVLDKQLDMTPHYLPAMQIGTLHKSFEAILHRHQGVLILELEASSDQPSQIPLETVAALKSILSQLHGAASVEEFCRIAAQQVRRFIGFDRVMVYKFLEDDSGRVIAEDKRADLEPFLGLHYPASDIPKQARALYVRSWLRFKTDNEAVPVPLTPVINPITQAPLDMSYAVLRSMSPIHTEYLRNMGVQATMSISIIRDNRLWGLVACHHYTPRYVSQAARMASELLAHMLSLQVAAKEDSENHEYRTRLNTTLATLIEAMAGEEEFIHVLLHKETNFLHWLDADGVAIAIDEQIYRLGSTPEESQIRPLLTWMDDQMKPTGLIEGEIFATQHLSSHYPAALSFQKLGAGLLAVRLARYRTNYILWFRGEVAQEVHWAGNPNKPVTVGEFGERLTPRKSFDLWIETVQGRSRPWQPHEIEAVRALRRSILEIILRRVEALAKLNAELERSNLELDSFAYVASHDLKEPLRGIHNYSHFLLEDYAEKFEEAGVEKLKTITRLTQRMDALLDSLLYYSRIGRQELALRQVDLQEVVDETLEMLQLRLKESQAHVRLPRPLPSQQADAVRVSEIFSNLISNAIKYNINSEKWVEIGYLDSATPATPRVYYVRDNGIGIPVEHQENIFRIFKRLHNRDEYGGGVGAGLTIVKKIIERHGGKIWLESVFGTGTTFYFTLEKNENEFRTAQTAHPAN